MDTERAAAVEVLERNWRPDGGYTSPNPTTYPWLWLWDSCFHAVIWAALDDSRALRELTSALRWQTDDGFVPHMGYQLDPPAARPLWGRDGASTITQPPMYGHAVRELVRRGHAVPDEVVAAALRGCDFLWQRRRAGNGLLGIVHPWEGGTDDSPRWDGWCEGPYDRFGTWRARKRELVGALELTRAGASVASTQFTVQPAGFNALCAFNLAELATLTGDEWLAARAAALTDALDARWDTGLETWTDAAGTDAGQADGEPASTRVRTLDALLGVLVTRREDARASVWRQLFDDEAFGAPFGPCGVHRGESAFDPDTYWRGPAWPQLNYLFWVAAVRQGRRVEARRLADQTRRAALRSGHAEYWNPVDAGGRGAAPQSWTALWLVMDPAAPAAPDGP